LNQRNNPYIYQMETLLIILAVLAIFPLALIAKKQDKNSLIKMSYVAIVLLAMGYLFFDYFQNPKDASAFTLIILLVLVSTNKLFNPKATK
jgi:uncharacterized membrane protein YbjE (DUF340 family)